MCMSFEIRASEGKLNTPRTSTLHPSCTMHSNFSADIEQNNAPAVFLINDL